MTEIFGAVNVEAPAFEVLKKTEVFEVRKYGKQLRATYSWGTADPNSLNLASNEGGAFRKIAGYIFGGNTKRDAPAAGSESIAMTAPVVTQVKSESIAMTAPVVTQVAGQQQQSAVKTMSFIMPSKYTSLEQLPVPKDADVRLETVPEQTLAVIKFTWSASSDLTKAKEQELREACGREGVQLSSDPKDVSLMQYNPPWCLPFLRTNEIAIKVNQL